MQNFLKKVAHLNKNITFATVSVLQPVDIPMNNIGVFNQTDAYSEWQIINAGKTPLFLPAD